MKTDQRLDAVLGALRAQLDLASRRGTKQPLARRRVRVLMREIGQERLSQAFLRRLADRVSLAALHVSPALSDPAISADTWLRFGLQPHVETPYHFRSEEQLRYFVDACLGSGRFRHLRPFRAPGYTAHHEFRLPQGGRIDLLCREYRRGRAHGLVAIELKRKVQAGTIEQLIFYLEQLRELFPRQRVRGMIISADASEVARMMLTRVERQDIEWLCYRVGFSRVSRTRRPGADYQR